MVTPLARGALLRAAENASRIDIATLCGDGDVIVLAPHPDDETVGCGAAIAAAGRAGHRVAVVTVTDGARSHPNSVLYPPNRLAALRFEELGQAMTILTSAPPVLAFLGYGDQCAPSSELDISAACDRLAMLVELWRPASLWTTWELDPHVDHRRTAEIARRVAARFPYVCWWRFPVWGRFTEDSLPPEDVLYRFDGAAFRHRKAAALKAHASQTSRLIEDDPTGFVMDSETQAHFLDSPELFIRRSGHV